ncbi:electron transfer flavoprotein alpha subunit apoprotein [Arboricoccus pini]|uniref:Electron transfer flavoprotein alpha subunit apoprotein n=1 Tax=Arboricoccus pini TaxID=1963835 RepID=A0A212R8X5_9PROT|nr:electron transfer flavoprotein subunit alpha/FixB family protein [Arboricoccus pini]SNB68601.1 electron transfer flavoprotein alpha subunit apoprotein [Arboricoccus pini]
MSRPRLDPRALRLARQVEGGGKRPRFALKADPPALHSRRRDPRLLRMRALVPGARRPRYDWKRDAASGAPSAVPAVDPVPANEPIRVESPAFWVLAVLDQSTGALDETDLQLLSVARRLAGDEGGVVALALADPVLATAGADRLAVWPASAVDPAAAEARAATVQALVESVKPRHVLCSDDPVAGGDIARRLAAKAGLRLVSAVNSLTADGRIGRRAGDETWLQPAPALMTIMPGSFAADEQALREARPLELPPIAFEAARLANIGLLPVDPESLPLDETDFIASAGNGVTDFAAFAEAAAALGATRAGSRVVCDAGLLPRDRQVGASGTVVTARCYLALGIAGAPQHLQGITGVRHVIAVNTDLHAEMIKRADLSIIADAQAVMPALARLARQRQEKP